MTPWFFLSAGVLSVVTLRRIQSGEWELAAFYVLAVMGLIVWGIACM